MMSIPPLKFRAISLLLGLVLAPAAFAINDPEVPTSNNAEIMVLPAPGEVVVDGKDDDWDLSAGIWSYNDPTLVKKYSVWTHMMYDQKGVYLLMRYNDPSPMKNATRGEDFDKSWRADAFQGRVIFDGGTPEEHQMHINCFYSSTENAPYTIVHHGGLKDKAPFDNTGPSRPDQLAKYGVNMSAFGGKIAFRPWDDGKGYNMEVFWPWKYLRTSGQPLKAGDSFVFGLEAFWGSADGTSLAHRLVDNFKNDKVNRIFFFRARDGWGKATLSEKGHLAITEEQKALQGKRLKLFVNYDTQGSVPISYTLPDDRDVTIAIDNAEGRRVRNLFGQFPRSKGQNTDFWDGLDDKGSALPAGIYTAHIVDHAPVGVKLINSVFDSATPPWPTATGRRLWGSNHGNPTSAATRGDVILVGFTGVEGATGLLRVSPEGKILWTDPTELLDITLNEKYAFLVSRQAHTGRSFVRRLDVQTGAIVLFENAARSSESVLPVPITETKDATIAYAGGKLFNFVPGKDVWRMDPNTGAIEATLQVPDLLALKDHNDELFGLFNDGTIAKLDADGKPTASVFTAKNLKDPARFAISQDGKRFGISDKATNQVFVYSPKGELVQTIGQAYASESGRPAGKFIETDLIKPLGLAFDAQDRLWIAEADSSCRRVTCWTPDAKIAQQFWGAADYGAMRGFPFTFDSTRFIAMGIEFALDPNPDILNRPTQEKALMFHPALSTTRGVVYRYKGHEYAACTGGNKGSSLMIAKRDKSGIFQTVMSLSYPTAGKKATPGSVWTDKNDNGIEDAGETKEGVQGKSHYWSTGYIAPDLTIITPDQKVYRLKGLTESGVPLYDFNSPETPKNKIETGVFLTWGIGTMVMDKAGNISDGLDYFTVNGRTGSYPNPYGRHDAPAARRGLVVAPFRANGVVEDVPGVGSITAVGGDRGQWFLMSLDGIFLSSILQDSKGDVVLDETYIGQESFGGFFWRDEKRRLLAQLGGASFRIVEITGLETTRKEDRAITLTEKQVTEGIQLAEKRLSSAPKEPEVLTIAKVAKLPTNPASPETSLTQTLIDGAETTRVQESGDPTRWFRVALAQDGNNLAIAYQVNDANPWKNGEGRFTHAFIGGDSVDLKLDIPGRGLVRLLTAPVGGKNTVIYWQQKAAQQENPTTYVVNNNGANAQHFDVVKRLDSAKAQVEVGSGKYSVLVTVPLAEIGLDPSKVTAMKGIAGVIFSDPSGTNRASRLYWFDKGTGLVSDVPSEAKLNSSAWGNILIAK